MKEKIISLIFALLIFLFRSSGCNSEDTLQTLPDDFIENVKQNYSVRDANLCYYTAWIHSNQKLNMGETGTFSIVRIAEIDGVDKEQFVAGVVQIEDGFTEFYTDEIRIYSHKDAPDPLVDWTVSDIVICEAYGISNDYRTMVYRELVDASTVYSWKENGKDQAVYEEIMSATRTNADVSETRKEYIRTCNAYDHIVKDYKRTYCLYIRFEENENIMWWSKICVIDDSFYLYREPFNDNADADQSETDGGERLGKLGDSVNEIMNKLVSEQDYVIYNKYM